MQSSEKWHSDDHFRATLQSELDANVNYWLAKVAICREMSNKVKHDPKALTGSALSLKMDQAGILSTLEDAVYQMNQNSMRPNEAIPPQIAAVLPTCEEPIDEIDRLRQTWEQGVSNEVYALAREKNRPLLQPLAFSLTPDQIKAATEEAAFLYDTSDLLQVLKDLRCSNRILDPNRQPWGILSFDLARAASTCELQQQFGDFHPSKSQIGADEALMSDILGSSTCDKILRQVLDLGRTAVTNRSKRKTLEACRRGCSISTRPQLWMVALSPAGKANGIEAEANSVYKRLGDQIDRCQYITDSMYRLDAADLSNDVTYFPFEEIITQVLMTFSRDPWISQNAAFQIHEPIQNVGINPSKSGNESLIPPSGVQPFRGLSMYIAPLCYLYDDPSMIYAVFRRMYAKYWCRLNVVRSQKNTLLWLCNLFEQLVQRYVPDVVFELVQQGVQPLDLVFPWIQSAFSGYLEVDQVLLLWDRVIGYEDLDIIGVFAAALFIYRAPILLDTAKLGLPALKKILRDNDEIQVIPIIQYFLFADMVHQNEDKSC